MTTPGSSACLTLAAAGDVCLGDHYVSLGHGTGSRVAAGLDPFAELDVFRACDLAFVNLEAPLSDHSVAHDPVEAAVFRAPPSAAGLLAGAGIGLLHVANNHMLQHGDAAFRSTIASLGQHGLAAVGVRGADPVVRTVRGVSVGFCGFSFVREAYAPGQHCYSAPSLDEAVAEVRALAARVNVAVVSVHWGDEFSLLPRTDVVDAAHAFVDAGATLVLGHHPHWVQPVERVGRALVAYSLGDLVFDFFWELRCVRGVVLEVDLDAGGVRGHRLLATRYDRDHRVRRWTGARADAFLRELEQNAARVGTPPAPPDETGERVRKLAWFMSRLPRGHTRAKVRFALSKATRLLAR